MKKTKKIIKGNNIPPKLPFISTVVCLLALDYWNAPEWLYGVMGLIYLINWIASIYIILNYEKVDLLNNED